MRAIGLLSLAGALCLAATQAIHGTAQPPHPSRFDIDVTVTGKMPHVSGAIGDLFLQNRTGSA